MEFLETVTLKQVFDFTVGLILAVSAFLEFSKKIPFHPWSYIIFRIGKVFNGDLKKKLEDLETRQNTLNEAVNELKGEMDRRFNESAKESDTKEAKQLRSRIIDFADSCRLHQKHTRTSFENISRDYDDYIAYCERAGIENHFIVAEFEYISDVFMECQRENKFL